MNLHVMQIIGSVDILELGGTTAYTEAVIPDGKSLPGAEVYPDVHVLGNPASAALPLEVLQAHLRSLTIN